jgi:large subunit ribosomal protein L32e
MGCMSMSEQESSKKGHSPPQSSDLSKLLDVRKKIKARTPKFHRFESWRYVRIDSPWRKPKGVDNHMRLSVKGWPHLVKVGYRVPKGVRNLHPSGYRDVLVHNLVELERLSPQTDAARLAAGVGKKKRIELARRAKELGIRILNGRNLLAAEQTKEESEEKSRDSGKKRKDDDAKNAKS